ncbi:hypothetical protein [Parabacteroides sp. FAFU027]|uniref:hypothetical protein n=1 Tax=Parabacteroides sp. FAFU027 TaxID=2922715 RepID=UPI001FB02EAF|nr:hypothetical protein [Parabacteroides sp. FAFU027]
MIRLLSPLTLLLGLLAFGPVAYSSTKIIFKYSKGHNSWNNPGIYGNSEQIEYTQTNDNNFRLTRFFRVACSAGKNGRTFTKDTTEFSTKKHAMPNKHYVKNWLIQLNTHKENYNDAFVKPLLTKPDKKTIAYVAKSIDQELFFDKDFKKERKTITKKIQTFYRLDSFLIQTKPNIENSFVVTDVWHNLRIEVINNNDSTIYQSQFWDPFGQPISRYEHYKYRNEINIINLEANIFARAFLPKGSLTFKILDINNVKQEYIKWCLKKYF